MELSNTIFKPLENHLQGEQLFICPDNALTLIPFDILPLNAENNQLLIDKYNITYLTAARDLLRYQYNPNRPASESLVIADPNFDLSVDISPNIPNNDNSSKSKIYIQEEGLSINLDSLATEIIESLDNLHDYRFSPVPEIAEIAKVAASQFNVQALLQNQALKSYLTNGKCPEILVLATHGFFLTQKSVPKNLLETQEFGERGLRRSQQMQITENPLFRSGFALAGANTWLLGGEIPPEAGEGIVFAQDVAGFDLWANKIILLIACQTAVGDVTAGEGVKGLRSAFTAAGARLLIMSLWSVPVKPSILLMNRFFANMDNRKLPAQIALKEAQNYIRTMTRNELESLAIGKEILQELQLKIAPVLQRNPELANTWKISEYPLQHPYFWGAWVCVGRELKEEENQ
ncbi:CHAT domain-containing protein [Anabaena sp. UHCC 0253]|nr:CHAT domain-containing protein [Anabaena sp. UHCC 0253]